MLTWWVDHRNRGMVEETGVGGEVEMRLPPFEGFSP